MENEVPIKSIPANLEAERAVLGSLLIDPDAIIKVANFLRVEDTTRVAFRRLTYRPVTGEFTPEAEQGGGTT